MSATGRGKPREENDFYPTPADCIDKILPHVLQPWMKSCLDPAAGDGIILDRVKWFRPDIVTRGIEIDSSRYEQVRVNHNSSIHSDALVNLDLWSNPDIIITNPPYGISDSFLRLALNVSKHVVFLLRQAFIVPKARGDLFKNYACDLYFCQKRPSFVPPSNGERKGNDNAEYAWYYFHPWSERKWYVI